MEHVVFGHLILLGHIPALLFEPLLLDAQLIALSRNL